MGSHAKVLTACLFLLTIAATRNALSQEYDDEGDSAYGYTALTFDTTTNLLTGYTETDLDPNLNTYYIAYVSGQLKDANNRVLSSGSSEDVAGNGYASLTLTAAGSANATYTMVGHHNGVFDESDRVEGQQYYYDAFDLSWWTGWGILSTEGLFDFYSPELPAPNVASPEVSLGSTTDSATLQTPANCGNGDVRNQMIQEYFTLGVTLHPVCANFASMAHPVSVYPFSLLNSSDYPMWAILQSTLFSGTASVVLQYKSVPPFSRAYSNPVREKRIDLQQGANYTVNSRHEYGDGIDYAVPVGQIPPLRSAGIAAGACAEPARLTSAHPHVHLDWRATASLYPTPCPPKWLQ